MNINATVLSGAFGAPPPYQVSPQSSLTGFTSIPSPIRVQQQGQQPQFVVFPQPQQQSISLGQPSSAMLPSASFAHQTYITNTQQAQQSQMSVGASTPIMMLQSNPAGQPYFIVMPPTGGIPQQQHIHQQTQLNMGQPVLMQQHQQFSVGPPQPQIAVGGMTPHIQLRASQTSAPMYMMPSIPPMESIHVPTMNASIGGAASLSQAASTSTSTRPPTDVQTWGFAVVDQYHPALQRLPVPPSVVAKTRGVTAYNNDVQSSSTKPCSSSVCLKFTTRTAPLSESCQLGEQCNAFHVERSYLEAARKVSDPLCCALHNDYFSQEMLASNCAPQMTNQRFTLVLEDRAEVELVASQLSLTIGLDQLSHRGYNATSTRVINMRKQICRLHYEGKCKWTKDCGHVHLCRELHRFLLSFHFPSLIFLLVTESNTQKIHAKISEEPQLGEFIRSKCVIPLVTQLIETNKMAAIQALLSSGASLTDDQVDALTVLGALNLQAVNRVALNPKIAHLLKPSLTASITPPLVLAAGSGSTPNRSELHDEALVAVQVAEAILSPTHDGKNLAMPTFSPSGSVTSVGVHEANASTGVAVVRV